jgi:diguanylate cyclase (GGDEF)-like protein
MARRHLESKVARRLFLLFLIAALLPMGGLAIYAYTRVGDILITGFQARQRQASKTLGMRLIQELNWRSQVLRHEADQHLVDRSGHKVTPEGFLDIRPDAEHHFTKAEAHHLELGKVVLDLANARGAGVYIMARSSPAPLFARLDMLGIWNNDEAPENYCALAVDGRVLHCTPGLTPPTDTRALLGTVSNHQNSASLEWRVGDEDMLGAHWRARLQAAYAHPGFIVLVAEPKQVLFRPLRQFRLVFGAVATLAFGLALLLALSQIRRQMRPLESLAEGTRRLAAGDFETRVEVKADDEFGHVANAFNNMSASLSHKFNLLRMLAELDRAILSASEMDYVIAAVLDHIDQSIPCDAAGIMRIDEHGTGILIVANQNEGKTLSTQAECRDLEQFLPTDPEQSWHEIAWGEDRPSCLRRLTNRRLERALVFPARVNGRLACLLILAYEQNPAARAEIIDAGRSLVDRLSVAASNIAWEERLYHQGHYDALTDQPNRVLLRDRVEQALMRAARERKAVALLLIDLDNFKQINDSLGHSAGDELLIECARRLQTATRQSDTAARLGGDEFVLLIPDLDREGAGPHLDALARKLNALLADPMTIADRRVTTPASIGIAIYPDNASGYEELMKMADAAMYESKHQQLGGFRFYSREMNAEVRARFELTQDLREAVTHDELLLYYQPKVSPRTGIIVAAEALVRWNSPKRGLVPPGAFVPLLDEIGLGNWLGAWAMDRACAQMAAWDRLGLPAIPVSVNIAPQQFQEGSLVDLARSTLARHGLDATRLELEILEATAANDSPEIRATLVGLREMGVTIALDDFGTGYSSLVYLTQLPADVLKLDRAFLGNLTSDSRQRAIVERIIALARALGFKVVAEGVEETAQMTLLSEMGCDLIQGFLFSRPLPADDFAERLRAQADAVRRDRSPGHTDAPGAA